MARFTMSATQRVASCPASAALPQVTGEGERADRGRAAHAYLAELAKGAAPAAALASVPEEYREWCSSLRHPGEGIAEPAFAYDVKSGKARLLGLDIGRAYGKLAWTEIAGAADWVRVEAQLVTVRDYKTGRTEVAVPEKNLQLGALAVAAAKVYGATRARVEIVHIYEDGGQSSESAELDAFALARVQSRLRETWDRVEAAAKDLKAGVQPRLHEGPHCKFCPARSACPAKVGLVQRLITPEVIKEEFRAALNGATAAAAYSMVERAGEVLNDLRAQLYQWAQENPIALPDGKVFGPVEQERETLKGDIVYRVLEQSHGREVALAAVELSASKASIERALKASGNTGPLAARKRAALEAIGAAGGIERTRKFVVKEHTPSKEQ